MCSGIPLTFGSCSSHFLVLLTRITRVLSAVVEVDFACHMSVPLVVYDLFVGVAYL